MILSYLTSYCLITELFRTNYNYQCGSDVTVTSKMEEALQYIISSYSVVIYGGAGERKTVCAFHLVKTLIDRELISLDRCALIYEPADIRDVRTDDVDLILIDNIFGRHNGDLNKLLNWRNYFETLNSLTMSQNVKVIIASRMHILLEYLDELDSYKIFSNKVQLCSGEMKRLEKLSILECKLRRFGRNMEDMEKEKCISHPTTELGFPLCCHLFASDAKLKHIEAETFKQSFNVFLDKSLKVLDSSKLVALAYVFCSINGLYCNDLYISSMSKTSKDMLKHISGLFGINTTVEILVKTTRNNIVSLNGSYLKEINGYIHFLHTTIYEAMARYMLKECPTELIENCTVEFLCQCVRLKKAKAETEIVIDSCYMESLAKRCIREVIHEQNIKKIAMQPAFNDGAFVDVMFKHLSKSEEIFKDFFSVGVTMKRMGLHGFLYHILSLDETSNPCFDKAYQYLNCLHSSVYANTCWKCQVKEESLAAVCSTNKLAIYEQLVDDDVNVIPFCLFKAVENPKVKPELVRRIIHDMKRCNNFVLDQGYLQMSLGMSLRHQDEKIFDILKSNGVKYYVQFLYFAVQKDDKSHLTSAIKDLIKQKRWKADGSHVSRALLEAQIHNNEPILNVMSAFAAKFTEAGVYWAVSDHSFYEVSYAVKSLKEANTFDCESDDLAYALGVAMKNRNYKVRDFLIKEGVIVTPKLVAALAELGECAPKISLVIQELKKDDRWDTEHFSIAGAYMAANKRARKELHDLLRKEGVGLSTGCFCYAVMKYRGDTVHIKTTLQSMGRFQSRDTNLARSLVYALEYRDLEYVKWLEHEGLDFNMTCLPHAVTTTFTQSTLETVIENIKEIDNWDTSCDEALVALNHAFIRQDKSAYDLLQSEGIDWRPRSLFLATKHETFYGLKQVLEQLHQKQMLEPSSIEIENAIAVAKSYRGWEKYREIRRMCQGK